MQLRVVGMTVPCERVGTSRRLPVDGNADCVVKCSADMLVRMVEQKYIPDPAEFMSGKIKTSDIPLLIEFSRVFGLSGVEL